MNLLKETTKSHRDHLEAWAVRRPPSGPPAAPWIAEWRARGRAAFEAGGFPTTRHEDWLYTDVSPIVAGTFTPGVESDADGLTAQDIERHAFGGDWAALVVLVNGHWIPRLSRLDHLPEGAKVRALADVLRDDPSALAGRLGQGLRLEGRGFVALNTALVEHGAVITVAAGTVVTRPVHVLHLAVGAKVPRVIHVRNLIDAGPGAWLPVVESWSALTEDASFTNVVTEIFAGDDTTVDHYRLQRESERAFHVGTLSISQGANSRVQSHSISTGAALARIDIDVVHSGECAHTTLNGLYMGRDRQHVDHHTCIDHALPRGESRQTYRGILDGEAQGVFNGKVIVRPGAQKTDAKQYNKNLLLSDAAVIDTKPQLEIRADDVKCAHGATIGRLDDDAIFYLRSRGLEERVARDLLTYAFASDLVQAIGVDSIRRRLEEFLATRFSRGIQVEGDR